MNNRPPCFTIQTPVRDDEEGESSQQLPFIPRPRRTTLAAELIENFTSPFGSPAPVWLTMSDSFADNEDSESDDLSDRIGAIGFTHDSGNESETSQQERSSSDTPISDDDDENSPLVGSYYEKNTVRFEPYISRYVLAHEKPVEQNPWTTFRVGFYIGVFVVLISILCISAPLLKIDVPWVPALIMYRGTFLIVFFLALISGNTYGWRTSGVNHVLIFEIDPRNHLSHQELLEMAGFFGVIWGLSVIGYLFSSLIHIPVFANPLALVAFYVIYLLNPIKILHYKARFWLLRVLFRIFTAPFHYVSFPDFWLADQLNSLAVIMQDFEFFICYYAFEVDWLGADRPEVCNKVTYGIRPLVALLPAWFRFAQCLRRYRDTKQAFPHLVNAGKYSTTFFVVVFSSLNKYYIDHHGDHWKQINAFFYLWIASCIVSSCYTYTWDIKMDWGLFDKNAGENRFLREEIVYAYKGYYYFGIIEDFILRFAWSITVSVGEGGLIHGEILKTVLAVFEVVRRFIWNFFRLENEHLNNCGQFRAVRDISITPIHANDQALLENMMDNDDGVQNRMKHKKKKTRQRSRTYKPVEVEPHRWPSNRLAKVQELRRVYGKIGGRRSSKYLLEDDPET
ncbi:solute carrier family 53 member 1-like isoform X5 [Tubulanus polymorphus]|uniref:solute carrier family 53 member 1-like isoform X5 n=1 Tax=Tubulanus polymorphus TaxID=672921 RepID=UPI003DA490C3